MENKKEIKKLGDLQDVLTKMGYTVTLDTRMGVNRVHVWSERKTVTVEGMRKVLQSLLEQTSIFRSMEIHKHKEIGVWVTRVR